MKISNVYEMYFSPTGNTKTTVECFSATWKIPKSIIDLTDMNTEFDKYEFYSDDLCIIGVPSYGERVPIVALQRIKQTKANNTPAIIIATYGNRAYGDTLVELQDTIENMGFCVVAALAVPTEHSIIHSFGQGRIDEMDKIQLKEMSNRVMKHIEENAGFNRARIPGNEIYREYNGIQLKPVSTSRCIKCGICASNCPVGAIPLDNPRVTDVDRCISCMRCIERCPKKARGVSRLKLMAVAQKLKKECLTRKDIEIFLNNNIAKEEDDITVVDVSSRIENVRLVEQQSDIVEVSVNEFSIEDITQTLVENAMEQSDDRLMQNQPIIQEVSDNADRELMHEEKLDSPTVSHMMAEKPIEDDNTTAQIEPQESEEDMLEMILGTDGNEPIGFEEEVIIEEKNDEESLQILTEEKLEENDFNTLSEDVLEEDNKIDMPDDIFNIELDMDFEDLSTLTQNEEPDETMNQAQYLPRQEEQEEMMNQAQYLPRQEEQEEIMNQVQYLPRQEEQGEIMNQAQYLPRQEEQEEIINQAQYLPRYEETEDMVEINVDNIPSISEDINKNVEIEMEDIVDVLHKAPEPEEIIGVEGVDVVDLESKERYEISDEEFFRNIMEIKMEKIDVDIDAIRPDIEITDDIGLKITDIAMLKKDEDGDGIDDDLLDNDAIFKILYMTDIKPDPNAKVPVNIEDYDYEADVLFK